MNLTKQILLHTMIWLFLITVFTFVATGGFKASEWYFALFVSMSILNVMLFYINLYLIIPVTLNKRKIFVWLLSCLVLIISFAAIKYGEFYYIHIKNGLPIKINGQSPNRLYFAFSSLVVNGFFVFLSTVYKFTVDWFFNEREKAALEKQKLTSELAFLKSQINPHFLFNSLNNIYSLAYQKSASTPDAILKLSEIMRYMLYESNDNRVSLEKEINYLRSFIELQRLRFGAGFFVNLDVEGKVSTQTIAPLVLISFVENAFKHGVANDEKNPIEINISLFENKLLFTLKNKKHHQNKDQTGGIGMVNVRRRLDLTYANKYKLNIESKQDEYFCELYLDL